MNVKTLFGFLGAGFTLWVSSLIFGLSMASPSQDSSADLSVELPEGEGKVYVQTLCRTCHGLEQIVSQKKTPEGWEATVYDMLGRMAFGMDREAEIISKYLAASFSSEPITTPSVDPAPEVAASPKTGSQIHIFHQVIFKFRPEAGEEQRKALLESGRRMLESIPVVATMLVGKVAQEGSEFPYGLVAGFESEEALEAYRSHPEHRKWLEEVYRPLVLESAVSDIVGIE